MPRRVRRRQPSPLSGALRLGIVFAVLAGVNAYIFLYRKGTSLDDLRAYTKVAKDKGPAAIVLPPSGGKKKDAPARASVFDPPRNADAQPTDPSEAPPDEDARVVSGRIGPTETLSAVLKREQLPPKTIGQVVDALSQVFEPRNVREGHAWTLRFDGEDRLRSLEYRTTPATLFRVERRSAAKQPAVAGLAETGESFRARRETADVKTEIVQLGGTIDSTLYEAVKKTGESTSLVAFFVDMFAWDLNFYIDTHAGDRFAIVVEKLSLDGKFYKYGRVLAAEYAGRAGTYRAFWFDPAAEGGRGAYYNERGESIVKSLLKTPLKYVHISSKFDLHRFHPILHTERAHLGVDYAAPTGTPVWATAAGKVTWKGPKGGAGNCVMVLHPGGMESIYMHLSKYAKGLEPGQAVRQKQVIGYVGATGLATGPHLHFSVKMGGHFVDPMRLKPAREAPLPPKYREAFRAAIEPRRIALAGTESRARVLEGPAAPAGGDPAAATQ